MPRKRVVRPAEGTQSVRSAGDGVRLLANWVRLLRGWTQVEMAAAVGLSQSNVSRYEKGLRAADLDQLIEVAGIPMWMVESLLVPSVSIGRAFATAGVVDLSRPSPPLPTAFVNETDAAAKSSIVHFLIRIRQRMPSPEDGMRNQRSCCDDKTARDLSVLVGLLRLLGDCTYEQLAGRAGIHPRTMSRYKSATSRPDRRMLEKLSAGAGVPLWIVECVLLPAIAQVRSMSIQRAHVISGVDSVARVTVAHGPDEEMAASLNAFRSSVRQHRGRDLDEWVVQLCSLSIQAAANDAKRAMELADKALKLAETEAGISDRDLRRQAYAWSFVGNAHRVAYALKEAEKCFVTAWRLWPPGKSEPASESDDRIAEWRLLDLEASLRRDQRHFTAALDLLDRTLALAPGAMRGRILLSRAYTLEQAGEIDRAVGTLQEAQPYLEASGDPNHLWALRVNRLVLLCHLERYREAQAGLAFVHALARSRENKVDLLKARWLTGRVWAGLGNTVEATTELTAVCADFTAQGLAYDAALVTLDLAILHLEAGRAAEVRVLAAEMLWIFKSQAIQREALAALTLFRHAVESATLTVGLARSILRSVEKSSAVGNGSAQSAAPDS